MSLNDGRRIGRVLEGTLVGELQTVDDPLCHGLRPEQAILGVVVVLVAPVSTPHVGGLADVHERRRLGLDLEHGLGPVLGYLKKRDHRAQHTRHDGGRQDEIAPSPQQVGVVADIEILARDVERGGFGFGWVHDPTPRCSPSPPKGERAGVRGSKGGIRTSCASP